MSIEFTPASHEEERQQKIEETLKESINYEVVADELQPEYLDRTMKKKFRWLMLFLCCIFVVANYFCYDNPASVESYIET